MWNKHGSFFILKNGTHHLKNCNFISTIVTVKKRMEVSRMTDIIHLNLHNQKCLVLIYFNFFSPKSMFWKKPAQKVRLVSIKCNFWKKLHFIHVKRTRNPWKELFRSIFPKARACFHISVGVSWAITKLPFNKSSSCFQFSRLFLIPLISSLCFALTVLLQIQHHPTITRLPPQSTKSTKPISIFDNPNTKSTKPNQK